MNPAARGELLELYSRLDAELAELQKTCRACGECCDFSNNQHVLYASRLEREVLRGAAGFGTTARNDVCPCLLDGRCSAREVRTLGCRTHFCSAEAASQGRDLYEKYRSQIAAICRRHGIEWDYRPVLDCLKEKKS